MECNQTLCWRCYDPKYYINYKSEYSFKESGVRANYYSTLDISICFKRFTRLYLLTVIEQRKNNGRTTEEQRKNTTTGYVYVAKTHVKQYNHTLHIYYKTVCVCVCLSVCLFVPLHLSKENNRIVSITMFVCHDCSALRNLRQKST